MIKATIVISLYLISCASSDNFVWDSAQRQTEAEKYPVLYESREAYFYNNSRIIIVNYQLGQYDYEHIEKKLSQYGCIEANKHSAFFDSTKFSLNHVVAYFRNVNHQRIK